jgi:hypothetical protein
VYAGAPVASVSSTYDRVTQDMLSSGYTAAPSAPGYAAGPPSSAMIASLAKSTNNKPLSGSYDIVPGQTAAAAASGYAQTSSTTMAGGAAPSNYSLAPVPDVLEASSAPLVPLMAAREVACSTPAFLQFAWYHGSISREDSEALLAKREPFCFLVRDSNQGANTFTVSVVKYAGGIAHILAQPVLENNRIVGYKFGKTDSVVYRSVPHLIESYLAMKGSMKTLGTCVPRK